MLGVCLRKQAKVVSISDYERFCLKSEGLKALNEALSYEKKNSDLMFELSVVYAEERNLEVALSYVKEFIDVSGGSVVKEWRLLVLVLLGQKRFREAENVINCGLEESLGLDREEFMRLKAKVSVCELKYIEAFGIYRCLLKFGESWKMSSSTVSQKEEEEAEFEVWLGLANLYLTFKQWKDVEDCLTKASKLKHYSPETKYIEGQMCLKRNQYKQALAAFLDGKSLDESFVHCKVAIGVLLTERGKDHKPTLPVAKCLLSDAIRVDSTNQKAWYYLGMVYKLQGCLDDALIVFKLLLCFKNLILFRISLLFFDYVLILYFH